MTVKQAKKEHKEHQKAIKPLLHHLKEDEDKMRKWPMKKQSKADRLDESLGMRRGKESGMKQSYKDRRDESKGASHHHKMAKHHHEEMEKHIDHLHRMAKVHKQTKADRMDESLGMRRGKESTKKQSYASRRHESEGAKKSSRKR